MMRLRIALQYFASLQCELLLDTKYGSRRIMQHFNALITEPMFWWMGVASVFVFAASLVAVPWVIAGLPTDYFNHRHRVASKPRERVAIYYLLVVVKNLAGIVLIAMGLAMLVLPGQGLLTIFIGLSLVNFPGKYGLERYLVSHQLILKPLNWVRRRAGKPHFHVTEQS